ncbi:retrotransposon protein, putative, ty3-gypsy subclass [Tanacetum coccineum]
MADWEAQIAFWNDPRNQARAAQNLQHRAKSTVVCRQGSRSLAHLQDQVMESSATREYPSLIHTFFVTHTVGREEILRLQGLASNTPSGVTYTKEVINALDRKSKQRGHLPGVGRVLSRRATDIFRSDDKFSQMLTQYESSPEFGNAIESDGCGDD